MANHFFVSFVIKVCEPNYSGIGNEHYEYDRANTMFVKIYKTENKQKTHKFGFKYIWHIMNKHLKCNSEIVHRSVHEIEV
ncbi:hypothetical protein GIB67_039342, partial [Kingdonia uniflora]